MKKGVIIRIILVVSILIISFVSFVSAESNETEADNETIEEINETETEETNETGINITETITNETESNVTEIEYTDEELADLMPEAGITPDSAFYGVDVFVDNVKATLTPSSLGKAKVRLDIMGERMAEMEVMASKNKTAEAKRAELEVQKQIKKFESSVEKIKKKDAAELNEYMQNYNARLEERKRRLVIRGEPDYADAIAEAIKMLETIEDVIVNIPEDLDPESTFKLSLICEEAGATTAEECKELISSGALIATFGRIPEGRPPDPHNCSGFWRSRNTKWCCSDSDGYYSPEQIEHIEKSGRMLNYYYRKGTVEYKIINLRDETVEEGIETDSCDGDTLTEWFCPRVMDLVTRNERFSSEYDCPYGCEDGMCIICNSDSICDENEDCSCSDCEAKRNGCENQYSVCQNGECVSEVEGVEVVEEKFEGECTDSDEGIYYFVKGTTIGKSPTSNSIRSYTDVCLVDSKLGEGYCGANNEVHLDVYLCPNGCQDGVCISS